MSTIVVRYRPTPDQANENQRLVEAVFAELSDTQPNGLRYVTYRLADGTFIHIADIEGDENPLQTNTAFASFQQGLGDRCDADHGPNPQPATIVGAYDTRRPSGSVPERDE